MALFWTIEVGVVNSSEVGVVNTGEVGVVNSRVRWVWLTLNSSVVDMVTFSSYA